MQAVVQSNKVRLIAFGATLVLMVSMTQFLNPANAAASCGLAPEPRDRLAEAPAAFVGRLVARPAEPEMGGTITNEAFWRFEVDDWVKGDLGPIVDVLAPFYTSVDFDVHPGERVGVFLRMRGAVPESSGCDTVDPDVLLAAAAPIPVADGTGPLAFLIGGRFSGARLVALDSDGGILGYGSGDGSVQAISVCPESQYGVEIVLLGPGGGQRVARRDLATLEVVEETALAADWVGNVVCRNEDGTDVLALGSRGSGEPGDPLEGFLISPYPEPTIVHEGEWGTWESALTPRYGVFPGRYWDFELNGVDLATGKEVTLRRLWTAEEGAGTGQGGPCCADFHSSQLSPNGSLLAVTDWKSTDNGHTHRLTVIDIATATEVGQVSLPVHEGEDIARWVGNDRVVVVSTNQYEEEEHNEQTGRVRLFEVPSMANTAEWEGFNLRPLLVDDGLIYAIDGPRLVTVPVDGGKPSVLRGLGSDNITTLVKVTEPIRVNIAAPEVSKEPATTTPPATLPPGVSAATVAPTDDAPDGPFARETAGTDASTSLIPAAVLTAAIGGAALTGALLLLLHKRRNSS